MRGGEDVDGERHGCNGFTSLRHWSLRLERVCVSVGGCVWHVGSVSRAPVCLHTKLGCVLTHLLLSRPGFSFTDLYTQPHPSSLLPLRFLSTFRAKLLNYSFVF